MSFKGVLSNSLPEILPGGNKQLPGSPNQSKCLKFKKVCEENDITPTGDFWSDVEALTKLNNQVRSLGHFSHSDLSDLSDLRKWLELNKSLSVPKNGRVRLVTTLYIRPKCPSDLSIF